MSWSDPCSKCGFHRADCECHKSKPKKDSLKYLETLPKAEEIYNTLFPKPRTHEEWAERFNKVGAINRIIMR